MLPFDTFAYAKELRRAGIPEPQVEAQVTALSQAFKHCAEKYPTKEDLLHLESKLLHIEHKLESQITATDLKLSGAINSLATEFKIAKWIGGIYITGSTAMMFRSLWS